MGLVYPAHLLAFLLGGGGGGEGGEFSLCMLRLHTRPGGGGGGSGCPLVAAAALLRLFVCSFPPLASPRAEEEEASALHQTGCVLQLMYWLVGRAGTKEGG